MAPDISKFDKLSNLTGENIYRLLDYLKSSSTDLEPKSVNISILEGKVRSHPDKSITSIKYRPLIAAFSYDETLGLYVPEIAQILYSANSDNSKEKLLFNDSRLLQTIDRIVNFGEKYLDFLSAKGYDSSLLIDTSFCYKSEYRGKNEVKTFPTVKLPLGLIL